MTSTARRRKPSCSKGFIRVQTLITRALLRPGDRVWLEDPGFPRTRAALVLAGADVVPVPVDAEGLDVDQGVLRAAEARFAVVTPSYQAPLGMKLSLARRLALLRWAADRGTWVIEDDYYGEFRFAGPPLPALKGLDAAGRSSMSAPSARSCCPRCGWATPWCQRRRSPTLRTWRPTWSRARHRRFRGPSRSSWPRDTSVGTSGACVASTRSGDAPW